MATVTPPPPPSSLHGVDVLSTRAPRYADPAQNLAFVAAGWRNCQTALNLQRETLIREVRDAVADGMSQSEAARIVGVDRLTIRKWLGA